MAAAEAAFGGRRFAYSGDPPHGVTLVAEGHPPVDCNVTRQARFDAEAGGWAVWLAVPRGPVPPAAVLRAHYLPDGAVIASRGIAPLHSPVPPPGLTETEPATRDQPAPPPRGQSRTTAGTTNDQAAPVPDGVTSEAPPPVPAQPSPVDAAGPVTQAQARNQASRPAGDQPWRTQPGDALGAPEDERPDGRGDRQNAGGPKTTSGFARQDRALGQPLPPMPAGRDAEPGITAAPDHAAGPRPGRRPRPRPDQRAALGDIAAGLADSRAGQVHRPCGTGKTLIGRWAAEQQAAKLIVVFLPRLQLLPQTITEWLRPGSWPFRAMIVCSDPTSSAGIAERRDGGAAAIAAASRTSRIPVTTDPLTVAGFLSGPGRKVLYSTYHSAPVVAAAIRAANVAQFDFAVLDEAHNLAGNPSAAFRTVLDDATIPARRRLFMTATPVWDDEPRGRRLPGRGREALSMNDTAVFGPVLHRLPFGQAVSQGLLCDYRVLVIGIRGAPGSQANKDPLPASVTLAALQDAVARFGVRRVLSFHTRVAGAAAFAEQAASATEGWPAGHRVWATAVSSRTPVGRRQMLLGRLAAAGGTTVGIVSNARCLTEGVDVPAVDGVLFADPRRSSVDIVQAAGRALRPAPDKETGTIIIPVALPAGGDDEEALLGTPFAHVWAVLRALRAQDDRLAAELDTLSRMDGAGRLKAIGNGDTPGGHVQFLMPETVPIPAVRLRMIRNAGSRWERMFGLLEAFTAKHGHARVGAATVADGEPLGSWVTLQRSRHRRKLLDPDRARRLADLPGWRWTGAEAEADRMLDRLTAHITRTGSAKQPAHGSSIYAGTRAGRGRTLGVWVATWRQQWRRGALPADIAKRLQSLPDWDWRPLPDTDLNMVDALTAFTAREGHGNPPPAHVETVPAADGDRGEPGSIGPALGNWTQDVRRRALLGRLHPALEEEILAATPLGSQISRRFAWQVHETRWLLGLDALAQYAAREQSTDVPPGHAEDVDGATVDLSAWCATQRALHHRGELDPDRIRLLTFQSHWTWDHADPAASGAAAAVTSAAGTARASRFAHGTPGRYDAGCPCVACLAGHQRYQQAAQLASIPQPERDAETAVPATRARRWLQELRRRDATLAKAAAATSIEARRLRQIEEGLIGQITPGEDSAITATGAASASRRRPQPDEQQQQRWRHRFDLLAGWIASHPGVRIPEDLTLDDIRIGGWVREQRTQWQRGRILPDRAALLEGLPHWEWEAGEPAWEAALTRLEAFAAEHGHAQVPQQHRSADGYYLGAWVWKQRAERAEGQLLPARAARLETIAGWKWRAGHDAAFDAGIAALQRFADRHGHACPTARYVDPDGFKVGRWVANHRHRRAALDPGQIAQLEAIPGWDWDPFETRWRASYRELCVFAAQTGHTRVAASYASPDSDAVPGRPALGLWVAQQRGDYSRGDLAAQRRRLLEALPGWTWDGYEARRRGTASRPGPAAPGPGAGECGACGYRKTARGHRAQCLGE